MKKKKDASGAETIGAMRIVYDPHREIFTVLRYQRKDPTNPASHAKWTPVDVANTLTRAVEKHPKAEWTEYETKQARDRGEAV